MFAYWIPACAGMTGIMELWGHNTLWNYELSIGIHRNYGDTILNFARNSQIDITIG